MRLALTGGATGIGAATVARMKADGHEVVVFDIQQPQSDDRWHMAFPAKARSALSAIPVVKVRLEPTRRMRPALHRKQVLMLWRYRLAMCICSKTAKVVWM